MAPHSVQRDSDSFVLPGCRDAMGAGWADAGGVRTRCALDTEQERKPVVGAVVVVVVVDEMLKARRYNKRVRLDFPHVSARVTPATSACVCARVW